jgi:hypothetical protein
METLIIAVLAPAYLAFFVLALRCAPDAWYCLRGKEEPASHRLTWETNSAHERALAAELQVAGRRRADQRAAAGALSPSIRPSTAGTPLHGWPEGAIR